ncbi:sphingomyelin phosphodiesterase 3-like [Elysia marginata]|uniref:Sphingomyelin phosphodiesterase 3-like n=1 Tax=Elysia marginata TaxID=1093978 RepID=A0AAV4FEA7_9GAST|nr:sphingomyelin phosphodiesterase 3-like [Elysia marginata]
MMDSAVSTPELLKQVAEDETLRQCYLLDADVTEHSKDTLVYAPVKLDAQGNVRLIPGGGRRRIDYILFDKQHPVVTWTFFSSPLLWSRSISLYGWPAHQTSDMAVIPIAKSEV